MMAGVLSVEKGLQLPLDMKFGCFALYCVSEKVVEGLKWKKRVPRCKQN